MARDDSTPPPPQTGDAGREEALRRQEAAAAVAELNAQLSVARAALDGDARATLAPAILQLQHAVHLLGMKLRGTRASPLTKGLIDEAPKLVESLAARWQSMTGPESPFRLPGGSAAAAALDLAAAIAERAACTVRRLELEQPGHERALELLAPLPGCLALAARVALLESSRDPAATDPDGSKRGRVDAIQRAMRLARTLLDARGPLALDAERGLCAGDLPLSGDTAVVDQVLRETGCGCTIFEGNRRIATTATASDSDERALGTAANAMVTAKVLEAGKTFQGITHTIGKDWLIRYEPLCTATGEVLGMVATYRELADVLP